MKQILPKVLLLAAYCIPYAFLAMNGDARSGTMAFYGLMLLCLSLLQFLSVKTGNRSLMLPGNFCSFISSYVCMLLFQTEKWSWYFKPFTGAQLLIMISVGLLLFQLAATVFHDSKHKERR